MANSFVEQATLRVNDQSSTKIRKINSELAKLLKTQKQLQSEMKRMGGSRGVKLIDEASLKRAQSALRDINRNLGGRRSNPFDGIERGAKAARQQTRLMQSDIKRIANTRLRVNMTAEGFAANMLGGAAASIGAAMAQGFTRALGAINRTAAKGALDLDTALTGYGAAGYNAAETSFVERAAKEASKLYPVATQAGVMQAFRDANTYDLSEQEGRRQAAQLMKDIARNMVVIQNATGTTAEHASDEARMMEKSLNLLGKQGPEAAAYREAMLQASIASGGDLSMAEIYRMLQQSPQLRSIVSPETLIQLALNRDSGGARGTGEINQFMSDLKRGNLNEADTQAQIKAGLRDAQGRSLIATKFGEDFNATVRDEIIPRLEKIGVDITDPAAVANALDRELGFSKEGGVGTLTDAVINLDQNMKERERAARTNPQFAVDRPSVRSQREAINSQLENLGAAAFQPLMPIVKEGLDAAIGGLELAGTSPATAATALVAANAALTTGPIATAAIWSSIMDEETRPLGIAALSLKSAADELKGAAKLQMLAAGGEGKKAGWIKQALTGATGFVKGFGPIGAAGLGTVTGIWELEKFMARARPEQVTDNFGPQSAGVENLSQKMDQLAQSIDRNFPTANQLSMTPAKLSFGGQSVNLGLMPSTEDLTYGFDEVFRTSGDTLATVFDGVGVEFNTSVNETGTAFGAQVETAGSGFLESVTKAGQALVDKIANMSAPETPYSWIRQPGWGPGLDTGAQGPSE